MKGIVAATAAMGLAICAGQTSAQAYPTMYIPAVDACQGALPSFEGALRKRPLGIVNQGSATTFVSCGLPRASSTESFIGFVFASVTNGGAGSATISCTLVDGFAVSQGGTPVYATKSDTFAPGAGSSLYWDTSDIGKPNFDMVQLSCALPPGTEINYFIQGIPSP